MSIAYLFILDRVGEYRKTAGTVACTSFLPRLFAYFASHRWTPIARLVTMAPQIHGHNHALRPAFEKLRKGMIPQIRTPTTMHRADQYCASLCIRGVQQRWLPRLIDDHVVVRKEREAHQNRIGHVLNTRVTVPSYVSSGTECCMELMNEQVGQKVKRTHLAARNPEAKKRLSGVRSRIRLQ